MKRRTCLALAATLAVALAAPGIAAAKTVRLAVTDIQGLESLQREFGKFRDLLADKTGYEIKFYPVNSRTAAAEALRSEKIDLVLTGPAEYVVIRHRTKGYPVVALSRPDYFSAIIVRADSGLVTARDLKGKTLAVGDVGSTSNHLAPLQLLADAGLDPRRDVRIRHVSRNIAWEALKRGSIDAIGLGNLKFVKLRDKERRMAAGSFRVIARGPDLPNDVLVAGKHVDKKVVKAIRDAFVEYSDALIKAITAGEENIKYRGMAFLANVKDSDYDYVRNMFRTAGYPEFSQFIGD